MSHAEDELTFAWFTRDDVVETRSCRDDIEDEPVVWYLTDGDPDDPYDALDPKSPGYVDLVADWADIGEE